MYVCVRACVCVCVWQYDGEVILFLVYLIFSKLKVSIALSWHTCYRESWLTVPTCPAVNNVVLDLF